jgi:hypothetical protein
VRGGRLTAGLAVAAVFALASCSSGIVGAPTAAPQQADDRAAVEAAVVEATGCSVDPRYGRDIDGIRFLIVGFGPPVGDPPHDAIDGSFTCNVAPKATLSVGAARFDDPSQADAMVNWLRGGEVCRPVAAVGPWMLFAGRAVSQPQASPELEAAVSELGGEMTQTCR